MRSYAKKGYPPLSAYRMKKRRALEARAEALGAFFSQDPGGVLRIHLGLSADCLTGVLICKNFQQVGKILAAMEFAATQARAGKRLKSSRDLPIRRV